MFGKTFMDAFVQGEAEWYELYDYVQYYATKPSHGHGDLRHALGMTEEEYAAWKEDDGDTQAFVEGLKAARLTTMERNGMHDALEPRRT